jgi:hypothetical protein
VHAVSQAFYTFLSGNLYDFDLSVLASGSFLSHNIGRKFEEGGKSEMDGKKQLTFSLTCAIYWPEKNCLVKEETRNVGILPGRPVQRLSSQGAIINKKIKIWEV